jgi:iron complex outermembrane receptor protein
MNPDRTVRAETPRIRATAHGVALACLAMCGGLQGLPARAQSAAAPAAAASAAGVQTITVTARKRDEKLIDVPISIQAFSEETLRASGTYDVQDLKAQAGFTYNENTGTAAGGRAWGVLTFRGLAGDTAAPYDNSGAFFVDGIYISGGVSSLNFNDAERVEVLKGPQNAFFGRSTFGGAVNIITRNPSTTLQGRVNTTIGNRGSIDADATVEGPLVTDFLRGRVSVMSHKKAAVARASDGGDLGAESTKAVSGTLYFTPTDNLWIRLRGNYQKDDDSSAAFGIITFPASNTSCTGKLYPGTNAAGASQPFTPAYPYACGGIPKLGDAGVIVDANTAIPPIAYNAFVNNSLNNSFVAHAPRLDHTGMARTATRTSAQAGWHLPYEMDLAFNAGHNEVNSMQIWDLDRSPLINFENALPMLAKDSTVDLRLTTNPSSALRGLLGASYFTSLFQYIQIDLNAAPPFYSILNPPTLNTGNYSNAYSDVSALYGSVEYDINKQFTASFDVRYQKDKIQSFTYAGVGVTNEKKNTLPRAILRFTPEKDTTTYVSYSEGVQPLTTNSGYTSASADGKAYIASVVPGSSDFSPQPKLSAWELGLKQRLLNNRLQYTLAAYDQKWENRLTTSFLFNPPGCALGVVTPACPLGTSGSFVVLGNEARIRGVEFAIDGSLTPQWQMGGTVDYKHARWTKYNNSSTPALTGGTSATTTSGFNGNTVAKVPDWTLTLNSTYRQALGAGWAGYLRGDLIYVGKAWDTDFNIVQTDPYTILNLRLGFEKAGTTIELFVKNATQEKNWTSVIRSADLTYQPLTNFSKPALLTGLQDPREYGIRASYKF